MNVPTTKGTKYTKQLLRLVQSISWVFRYTLMVPIGIHLFVSSRFLRDLGALGGSLTLV